MSNDEDSVHLLEEPCPSPERPEGDYEEGFQHDNNLFEKTILNQCLVNHHSSKKAAIMLHVNNASASRILSIMRTSLKVGKSGCSKISSFA